MSKSKPKVAKKAAKKAAPKSKRATPAERPSKSAAKTIPENLRLTNPQRVLYPDLGITKLDLANYYAQIANWILPHIAGRPLSLVRCPDGVAGQCFFQKHPPAGLSASVERIKVVEKSETNEYLVVHDLEGILGLVQFGALELHLWGVLASDIEHPDRMIFDLDPDPTVPWQEVVDTAFLMRDFLAELELTSFVKTTGGKGLHVVAPIAPKHTWDEMKSFSKAVADTIVSAAPNRYLATMSKAARKGKIFIDYLRNQRGATAIAAYSTRARAAATVSLPISWENLKKLKTPAEFTVQSVPKLLAAKRSDPWLDLPKTKQAIGPAMKRLAAGGRT
jgi:bifunctional non-homologous end joining protein LigD